MNNHTCQRSALYLAIHFNTMNLWEAFPGAQALSRAEPSSMSGTWQHQKGGDNTLATTWS